MSTAVSSNKVLMHTAVWYLQAIQLMFPAVHYYCVSKNITMYRSTFYGGY
jgi:hypothetical protein